MLGQIIEVSHRRQQTRQTRRGHLNGASRELFLCLIEKMGRRDLEKGLNGCLHRVGELEGKGVKCRLKLGLAEFCEFERTR